MIDLSIEECAYVMSALNVYTQHCANTTIIKSTVYNNLYDKVFKEFELKRVGPSNDNLIP